MILKPADAYENYKFLMTNYSSKVDEVLAALGSELPEYIRDNHSNKIAKIPQILITTANHQAQRVHVIDPAVTMLSAVFNCQIILNS